MTNVTVVVPINGYIASTPGTSYIVPTGRTALLDKVTVFNDQASSYSFTLYLCPSGGGGDSSTKIIRDKSLAQGEVYTCPEAVGHALLSGGFLVFVASTSGKLAARVTAREIY